MAYNKSCGYSKFSIRSSFSKIDSKNSLLGKILMDYASSIASPPLTLSLGLLIFRTVGSGSSLLPSETVTNTVKHEKICSFFQKLEYLCVVNFSEIAQ